MFPYLGNPRRRLYRSTSEMIVSAFERQYGARRFPRRGDHLPLRGHIVAKIDIAIALPALGPNPIGDAHRVGLSSGAAVSNNDSNAPTQPFTSVFVGSDICFPIRQYNACAPFSVRRRVPPSSVNTPSFTSAVAASSIKPCCLGFSDGRKVNINGF